MNSIHYNLYPQTTLKCVDESRQNGTWFCFAVGLNAVTKMCFLLFYLCVEVNKVAQTHKWFQEKHGESFWSQIKDTAAATPGWSVVLVRSCGLSIFFSWMFPFLFSRFSRSILSGSAAVLRICPAGASHDQPRAATATATSAASPAAAGAAARATKEGTQTGSVLQQKGSAPLVWGQKKYLNGQKKYCFQCGTFPFTCK